MEEALAIDVDFDIRHYIYIALRNTISHAIDSELRKDESKVSVSKEFILKNFLAHNLDQVDDDCYITYGPGGKVFLCGVWLVRPVFVDGKSVPMMEYLRASFVQSGISTERLVFRPDVTGIAMRRQLWPPTDETNSSYNMQKSPRNSFGEKNVRPAGGFPPFAAAGAPSGAGAPPGFAGFAGGVPAGAALPPEAMRGMMPPAGVPMGAGVGAPAAAP